MNTRTDKHVVVVGTHSRNVDFKKCNNTSNTVFLYVEEDLRTLGIQALDLLFAKITEAISVYNPRLISVAMDINLGRSAYNVSVMENFISRVKQLRVKEVSTPPASPQTPVQELTRTLEDLALRVKVSPPKPRPPAIVTTHSPFIFVKNTDELKQSNDEQTAVRVYLVGSGGFAADAEEGYTSVASIAELDALKLAYSFNNKTHMQFISMDLRSCRPASASPSSSPRSLGAPRTISSSSSSSRAMTSSPVSFNNTYGASPATSPNSTSYMLGAINRSQSASMTLGSSSSPTAISDATDFNISMSAITENTSLMTTRPLSTTSIGLTSSSPSPTTPPAPRVALRRLAKTEPPVVPPPPTMKRS